MQVKTFQVLCKDRSCPDQGVLINYSLSLDRLIARHQVNVFLVMCLELLTPSVVSSSHNPCPYGHCPISHPVRCPPAYIPSIFAPKHVRLLLFVEHAHLVSIHTTITSSCSRFPSACDCMNVVLCGISTYNGNLCRVRSLQFRDPTCLRSQDTYVLPEHISGHNS